MIRSRLPARINVKALTILVVVVGLLVVGVFGGHHIRKRMAANDARSESEKLLQQEKWAEACPKLWRYLKQYPDDVEMLETYAKASLSIRPRTIKNITSAIAAYRRLWRHRTGDDELTDQLVKLYTYIDEPDNTAYICEGRLQKDPSDISATLPLARISISQSENDAAAQRLRKLIENPRSGTTDAYRMLARIEIAGDSSSAGIAKALDWLNQGVTHNPDSAEALVNRSFLYLDYMEDRTPDDLAKARKDLESAEKLLPSDPLQLQRIARAWAALGELERAKLLLESLENVDLEVFLARFANPNTFKLQNFTIAASVRQVLGDGDGSGELADRALDQLVGPYRDVFLPIAIDLYLRAGRPNEATKYLADHRELVHEATGGRSAGDQDFSILRARVSAANGKPYDAIEQLRPVVSWDPDNEMAWQVLAKAYISTDQPEQAIKALRRMSGSRGNSLAIGIQIARQHIKVGEWSEALRAARACEERAPDVLEIKLLRIESALRVEFQRPARSLAMDRLFAELTALRKEHPKVAVIRMLQSLMAEHDGDMETATALLRGAVDECDGSLASMIKLGQFLERREASGEAAEIYGRAAQAYPAIAQPRIALARLHVGEGRLQKAEETLSQGVKNAKVIHELRRVTLALARLHLEHLNREQGITLLKDFADQHETDIPTRLALLEISEVLNDQTGVDRYIADLRAIEGDSGLSWQFHQSRMQLATGEWQDQESQIREALNECIEGSRRWRARSVLLLGGMQESLGDLAAAETIYRREFADHPNSIAVADRLLRVLESQRRFSEAKEILDQVTYPAPALDAHRVGIAIGTGEYDIAIEELENRIVEDATAAAPRIILARLIYSDQDDVERAFSLLDEAEKLDPDGLSVLGVRAFILNSEGRSGEAAELLDQAVSARADFDTYLLRAEFHMTSGKIEAAERDLLRLTKFAERGASGHEILGRFYISLNRPADAIAAWDKGLEVDPGRVSVQRALVRTLLAADDPDQNARGLTMLADLGKSIPDDVAVLNLRAKVLIEAGDNGKLLEARGLLQRAVELDQKSVTAHLLLLELAYIDGDLDHVSSVMASALNANPDNAMVLMAAAQLERLRRNFSMAEQFAESALRLSPRYLPAHFMLIEQALRSGDQDKALELSEAALEIAPDNIDAKLKRSAVLALASRNAEAIDILEDLAQRDGSNLSTNAWLSLAELYCREDRLDGFESAIKKVETSQRQTRTAVLMRLRCHALQEHFDQVRSLIQTHKVSNPKDTATIMVAAHLLASSAADQNLREARTLFAEVAAAKPANIDAHLGVAQTSYQLGDLDAALSAYRKGLAVDHSNLRALNDLSWILAEVGGDANLQESIELADRGVEYYPADSHLLDTRGVVLSKLGRLDQAVDDLKRAIDFAQDMPATRAHAMIHLAEVYKKKGDPSLARQQLENARALDREQKILTEKDRARIADLLAEL